ncbi:MAG: Ig-like domain-containing protein, partial [Clostridia bacterium]|nr:Ig-like domain-containing protein [Clostridia bacterium]
MAKKLIALLVAAMMVLALVPAAAFAKADPKTDTVEKADPAPKPAPMRTVIDSWDFETDPTEDGWQFLDNDGDGNNWNWASGTGHSGTYSIMSASYSGTALTPDNWAMSPWVSIPEGGANLSFWVENYSGSYPETFSIYYIVYGDEEWTNIALDESVAGNSWVEKTYFVPDTAGLQARIAIRHHDCVDQWRFYIDDVEIFTPTFPESITANDVTVPVGRHANVVYEILPEDTTATDVTFEIADTSVATVDANGVVTGVAEGTTTVTVTCVAVPNLTATANVTVTEAPPTANLEGFATYDLSSTCTKHFVAFTDAEPGTVTDNGAVDGVSTYACAYYDGNIYGYNYDSDNSNYDYFIVDAETFTATFPGTTYATGVLAMAYSYTDEVMYAITGDGEYRSLGTVDLETGDITLIAAFDAVTPMTLAIDGEGTAYTLNYSSSSPCSLYTIDLETAALTEIGSTGVNLAYVQSMTWDHATNQLFWAQISSGSDHGLYVLDPATAAATPLGDIGPSGMEIVGLFTRAVPSDEPPVELIPITEVYVNGYEAPVAGDTAGDHMNLTVPDDANYSIDENLWWNETDDYAMPSLEEFEAGKVYSEGAYLIANEGYYFADDCEFYVNGSQDAVDYEFTYVDSADNTLAYVWNLPTECQEVEPLNDLDAALNVEGGTLHFESEGTYPWIVVEADGRVFAQSSNGGNASTESILTLNVDLEEAQSIYFEFKAWGEGSYSTWWDECAFFIDDEMVMSYGAYDNDWELFTAVIPAGVHTLMWSYSKDGSVNPTGDYFAVDNVSIGEAPDVTVTFVDGIDGSTIGEITVTAGTVLAEEDFPEAPEHNGYVFDGWDYDGEPITVATTITAQYHDPNSLIWDFETNPENQGFVFVDEDGDGFNWEWH